eukprot:SAG31_NODE_258_length_18937_cov_61.688555_7_plen_93_part_00
MNVHLLGRRRRDFQWATVGASDNPCSNSYHGPSAFSETEPYALATFVAEEQREGELRLYVDHHCCGDMYLQVRKGMRRPLPLSILLSTRPCF